MTLAGRTVGALLFLSIPALPAAASAQAHSGDDLVTVLDRASAYVEAYFTAFSSVVAEERYEQEVTRRVFRGDIQSTKQTQRRVLVSDYLIVQVPGSVERMPFRDVYSVDGDPVRQRADRLLKLFTEPFPSAYARALQIRDESSRYNLGELTCDINEPSFALRVLKPDVRPRFRFREAGRRRADGRDVLDVEYDEIAVPTLVEGLNGSNVPSSGSFQIEVASGTVLRSVIETQPQGLRTRIEVRYRYEPKLEMLAPLELQERHELATEVVVGHATYANFRRFTVDTAFSIK